MTRLIILLGIVTAGMGLIWSQIFHRAPGQLVWGTTSVYQVIHQEGAKIESLIAQAKNHWKLLGAEKAVNTTEPLPPQELPPSIGLDRTIINPDNIIYFTNKERLNLGLPLLNWNAKLARSTAAKSRDMFSGQYFAHTSPRDSSKDFAYFISQQSYPFARTSENLAMGGFDTAEQVVKAWMESPGHRANIVYAGYRDIGVSVQKGMMHGDEVVIIIQHFGLQKTQCPIAPTSQKVKLESIQDKAQEFKNTAESLEDQITDSKSKLSDSDMETMIDMYNTAITSYNKLAGEFKTLVEQYNRAVSSYDDCIRKLTR